MRKQILTAAVMAAIAGMSFAAVADESTSVGGKAYIDFTNLDQKSNGTKTAASGVGVDVKRFYLSITHGFDDIWSANLTTDFNYVSSSLDGKTQVFVKKAYLQGKFADAAVVRAGSADMPWIPYVEDVYGYRWVENTLTDRLKVGNSADWGLNFGGKVADGMVNYSLSAVNGNGYSNPTRSKSLDFEGRVGVMPVKGLNLALGGYNGKLGQDIQGGTPTTNTASRYDALAAYSYSMFKVGAEYFTAKNFSAAAITGASSKANGYSVWGSVSPMEKLAVFARYDGAKTNKNATLNPKDTYYNVGVSYEARKNVDVALVYKTEEIKNNDGTKPLESSEIGVWSQVKF
jgi:Gram-negative porin